MNLTEIFGWLASVFTTIIFLPQLVKVIKTKLTHDISMLMLVFSVIGNGFWLAHASLSQNMPLLVMALLIILISITLIVFKYLNEHKS
ncbi:MAG: SemiSWEET family transporter [Gammaproteobacteria bacterium]|nr:SemiSWEET family transporter [Gammaproteobacteria bacterium]